MVSSFACHVRDGLDDKTRKSWKRACKELDFYREHEGKRYCVLHYPGEEKTEDFEQEKVNKLAHGNYNFRGTIFPMGTSDFEGFGFGSDAEFVGAVLCGTANFAEAKFNREAKFRRATFRGEADFSEATFEEQAGFRRANFEDEAHFNGAIFNEEARFRRVTFKRSVEFEAPSEKDLDEIPSNKDLGEAHSFYGRVNFSRASFEAGATFVGAS